MSAKDGNYQLHSVLALGDYSVEVPPGSPTTDPPSAGLIIPITKSWPDKDIAIVRTICRIHLLGDYLTGMYATTLFLVRASDFSLLGGCATDFLGAGRQITSQDVLADREFNVGPGYFKLAQTDSLLAIFRTFEDKRFGDWRAIGNRPLFVAKLDIIFAYAIIDQAGNLI